jgi:hypothetical protein
MKMMKNLLLIVTSAALSILLFTTSSCNKEEECEVPNLTAANISGVVLLYDDAEEPLDKSGMLVSILYSNPLVFDSTDANGQYTLSNLPFGTYTLKYEKPGYGTFLYTIDHENNCQTSNQAPTFHLGQRSTTSISSLSAETVAAHVDIELTINPAATSEQARYVRLFLKNQNDVSNSSYDKESGLLFTNTNAISVSLSVGELHGMGFISGETIYLKAYGDSFYSNDYYNNLGPTPYTAFPNTNIVTVPDVEFIVP